MTSALCLKGSPRDTPGRMGCTRLFVSGLLVVTGLVGGCTADDSDEMNGGLSPIVDGESGWVRIKSIPPQGPIGIGTSCR